MTRRSGFGPVDGWVHESWADAAARHDRLADDASTPWRRSLLQEMADDYRRLADREGGER